MEFFTYTRTQRRFSSGSGSGKRKRETLSKDPPIEHRLPCSLEDLCKGTTKQVQIARRVFDASTTEEEEEVLMIEIKPGWKKGRKIIFSEKGDKKPNSIPADVVFIIDEEPHRVFTRDGDDLIVEQRVSLRQALTGCIVHLTSIDGRALTIPISNVINPSYEEVVPCQGMPTQSDPEKRGNLRIKFHIRFPDRVNAESKAEIKALLRS